MVGQGHPGLVILGYTENGGPIILKSQKVENGGLENGGPENAGPTTLVENAGPNNWANISHIRLTIVVNAKFHCSCSEI